jgi:class 3 adenylate cyclase
MVRRRDRRTGLGYDRMVTDRHHRDIIGDPDERIELPFLRSSILAIGGLTLAHDVHQPGWRWSEHVRPTVGGTTCRVRHLGYLIGGRVRVRLDDGEEFEVGPGEAVDIPAGHDAWVVGDEAAEMLSWTGARTWISPAVGLNERILVSLLFTDVVSSTTVARSMGDQAWSDTIATFDVAIADAITRHGGRLIKSTGDGALAAFDGAARAIRAGVAIRAAAAARDLAVRTAIHTGDVETTGDDLRGLAIHEASRVMALAGPGDILVSTTTRELAGDAGIDFEDRGEVELRGFDGRRRIWAVRG